ncbi:T9SS type A sorting domain-containing protein [Hymenobacter sp. BT175]|uniref:T9SS type A sorting domain-containing protein n=1 Tax=Hymenobacter translucens TaxID=2886507 RepID=UPI001D0EF5B7|nr:T9SS type A sorting domain-containing protein [Hymenobacter translucens]MCC2546151.1 T9SS type A sorting domain-containing protein [Hymenobacter translucens]
MRVSIPLTALLISLGSTVTHGQTYILDPSFGTAGRTQVTFPTASSTEAVRGLQLLPDGRLVVAGRTGDLFGIARLTSQGQPDAGFGTAGQLSHSFALPAGTTPGTTIRYAEPTSILLQADGKLVVGGMMLTSGPVHPVIARYLASGAFDQSFGSDGRYVPVMSSGGLGAGINSVSQQPDGSLLTVSRRYGLSSSYTASITRLLPNGTLDNTYAHTYPTTGNETTPTVSNSDKTPSASVVDPAGRLLTAGVHYVMNQNYVGPQGASLVRYQPNGQYDASFGINGIAVLTTANGGRGLEWKKLLLQSDGKIVVASLQFYYIGSRLVNDSVGVARYQANGTLDPTFGRGGLSKFAFGGANGQSLAGFQLNAAGEFVVGVQTSAGLSIVRLTSTGQPITNSMGSIQLPGMEAAYMAVQPDEKIVVAGTTTNLAGTKSFGVARLMVNTQLSNRTSRSAGVQAQLYPNPAAQNTNLRLAGVADGQLLKLQVLDALGREVLTLPTVRATSAEIQLPLAGLRPGSYTLRIQGEGFSLTRPFIRVN